MEQNPNVKSPIRFYLSFLGVSGCLGVFPGLIAATIDITLGPASWWILREILLAFAVYSWLGCSLGLICALLFLFVTSFSRSVFHHRNFLALTGLIYPFGGLAWLLVGYYINLEVLRGDIRDTNSIKFNVVFLGFGLCFALIAFAAWTVRHTRNVKPLLNSKIIRLLSIFAVLQLSVLGLISLVNFSRGSPQFTDDPESILSRLERLSDRPPFADEGFPIIVIMIDTLRADHLSGYGYPKPTSPHLDRFAQDAVLFSSGFASSPWTIPSVATLFSGLYPSSHKTLSYKSVFSPRIDTLAECLMALDYATGSFIANAVLNPENGFHQGFGYTFPPRNLGGFHGRKTAVEKVFLRLYGAPHFGGARITRQAKQWLAQRRNNRVFAYVHFMEPHGPYMPPARFLDAFVNPDYKGPSVTVYPQLRNGRFPMVSPAERKNMIAHYDGEIAYVDQLVGDFLQFLRDENLYDPALIFVISDHGEEFFEHGGWGHGIKLYRELTKVPFIVKWPGNKYRGVTVKAPVELVDIRATIMSCLGFHVLTLDQGHSILDHLDDEANVSSISEAYAEDPSGWESIRTEEWSYIEHSLPNGLAGELFSSDDTLEAVNRVQDYPRIAAALRKKLSLWRDRVNGEGVEAQEIELDEERIKVLKSLGYLN